MSLKRKRHVTLVSLIGLTLVLLMMAWTVMADYDYEQGIIWTPPEQEESIAGAWILSWPPAPEFGLTEPLIVQETLTPLDPSGNRLLLRNTEFNVPDVPPSAEPIYNYSWTDFVGVAVKTGRNTYEYRAYAYVQHYDGTGRGKIVAYAVMTGKTELIDRDHRYDSELYVTYYGPDSDMNPADGFPDEGAQPLVVFGPLEGQWFKRVRLMSGPELPPPPEGQ